MGAIQELLLDNQYKYDILRAIKLSMYILKARLFLLSGHYTI